MLDLIELDAELADLLRPLTVGLEDGARVFALPLRARDFVAGRILLALQTFELGNQPPAAVLERRQLLELARRHSSRGSAGRASLLPGGRARKPGQAWRNRIRVVNRQAVKSSRSQGRLPCRRPRHPIPSRDQGPAERDAAARRQADHSIRRRRGRAIRRRQHHHRHRPRQERHRRSLRRQHRARKLSAAARQDSTCSKRSARSRT